MTLPDDFDTAAAKVAGQASGDPIDGAAAQVVQGQRTALRSSLYGALLENPDMAARAQKLGRKTGIPADVVGRNLPEVERNAKLDEFDRVLERSPTVAQWLAEQNNAKVAHDDVENLVAIEEKARQFGSMRQVDRSVLQSLTEPVQRGLAQGARGLTLLFNDLGLFGGLQRQRDAARVAAGLAPEGNSGLAVQLANQQREVERYPIPEDIAQGMNEIGSAKTFGEAFGAAVRNPRAILETSLQSLGSSAPALLTSAGGSVMGPFGTAAGAGMGSFAVEYGNTLQEVMAEKGVNPRDPLAISNALADQEIMAQAREKAVKRGLPIAAFDALTAGLAGRLLAGAKPTVASVGSRAAGELGLQAGGGAAGEAVAQGATGEFKPGDILLEALAEMPTAIVEVPGNFRDAMVRAQAAEQRVQVIEQLNTLAEASKVRERDADTFEQFIAQATDGAEVSAVYIDAKTLAQSGMAEQLAALSPSVAEQLPAALATGGEVRIPVAEYTARIAGTEFAQGLLDDLRVEGEQFTRREAQEFMQNQAGELEAEFDRVLAEKQADDTFKASADAIKAEVKSQLDSISRFNTSANDAYASLVGNWFAVKAADLGMTPQELFAKYPLRVVAEGVAGAQVLEQGGVTVTDQVDEVTGLPLNSDGTVTVYHHTSAANAEAIGKSGLLKSQAEPDVYVTTRKETDTGYGDTAVPIRVKPELLRIDDEFPDGRVDYRVGTGKPGGSVRVGVGEAAQQLNQSTQSLPPTVEIDGKQRPTTLMQNQAQGNRGSFSPSTNTITLLKGADLSTFLHESGHFFLETQFDIASRLEAQRGQGASVSEGEQRVLDDTYALLKWFGVEDLTAWHALDFEQKRPLHEQFARGFEAYLFEGRAPSLELQGLFQRFRAWLIGVYKDIKALNVELTDEVRGVMDRMLATSEQIKLAEQGRSMMPLFTSPEQAGMTPEEFAAYQALGVDATNEAIEDVQARTLRDMQWLRNSRGREVKRLQKQSAELRAEVKREVTREVMSQPVYRAWQFLTAKEGEAVVPGVTDVAAIDPTGARGKLRTDALKALGAPDEVVARVMGLKMTSPEGMHPDIVAEMFGFSSGDELVRNLAAADKPADAIEGLVDARMLEQYGELATPEAIERAADQAIHNEARARFVATEANALAKAAGRPKILASAARDFARMTIARLKVRNLRPGQYAMAEVRAAKAAAKASQSGDLATAAAEKRNQLVQNYLTKSAHEAQDDVDRGVRYLKKFDSDGFRKTVDADYADQIDALLERFDLRMSTAGKEIDRRKSLLAWAESQREQGFEPDIPEGLLDEARRQSYKEMSVEEFRGLLETVKQIEHLGRLKNRLLTAADNKAFDAVKAEIVGGIEANSRGRVADTRTPTTNLGRAWQSVKNFGAEHIKVATWARIMDGGKDGGPVWEYLVRSANERGNMETTMRAEATAKLAEILAPVLKLGRMGGAGQFFATINRSLNREARLAIALNTGNQGNLQRLLGGEGWTVDQIQPVLQSLTAAEWRAVQAVWDHFESYRPQIGAKERRVYGKEPTWVDPTPFSITTADGQKVELKGGYYPIKYDPAASQRAEEHADAEGAKRQLQGAYTSATTRRSFTKTRAEEVSGRPLLYTLSGLYGGVNDVIHDLTWHEWLIDANRIMRSKTIDAAIRNTYGPAVKAQFKTWINDIAEGDRGAQNAAEVALGRLRQGVSAAGLGFNVTSAAMQITGFNQSIVRVGAKWIAKGVGQFVASPAGKVREVVGKSEFMADRSRTQFRELNELRNRVQDESATMRTIKLGTYFLMMRMQRVVDVPTWLGAYEKAMAEGNAEERAIALADQAVIDSQGSGMTKDLAGVERGGPVLKLFTVYYSYMNTALNMGVAQTMTAKSKAKLAADLLMLYTVPAVLGSMLKDALTPGGDDDDDMEALARKLAAEQLSYLMGLFIVAREFGEVSKIVTGAEGVRRDYSGPAGLRAISDTISFAKQAQQGEFDTAFRKASINLVGDLTGLPSAQINRTINGFEALEAGETDNPAAVLFGYQK